MRTSSSRSRGRIGACRMRSWGSSCGGSSCNWFAHSPRQRYTNAMPGETIISILRRVIDQTQGSLSKEMAEAILRMQFAESDQRRIEELAEKSEAGTLSDQEGDEYDAFIEASDLLSLWKSKARLSLKQHSSAA